MSWGTTKHSIISPYPSNVCKKKDLNITFMFDNINNLNPQIKMRWNKQQGQDYKVLNLSSLALFLTINVYFLVCTIHSTYFKNNIEAYVVLSKKIHLIKTYYQVPSKSKNWKANLIKVLGAIKQKGLNRIVKISYGHICLRENK